MLRFLAITLLGAAVCNAALIGGGLVGGYKEADKNDADVKEVLSFAETTLNAMSNSMYSSRVGKVIDVQRQLVNGINYKVKFEFERTTCAKTSMITLESCPKSDEVEVCTVVVYQAFSGEKNLDDFNCKPVEKGTEKRAGGISKPVEKPEKFRAQALRALSIANSDLDASSFKIVEVRTQTVAGQNIFMTLEGLANGVLTRCTLTIWSRVWIKGDDGFQVTDHKCSPVLSKRNVLGGGCTGCVSEEKDVDDVAKTALFDALNNDDSDFQLDTSKTKFVSMTEQVVAGTKYEIKVQTEIDGKMTDCSFTVWSRPWMTPANELLDNTCE